MRKNNHLINRAMRAFEKVGYRSGKVCDPFAWWPLNFILYAPLYMPRLSRDLCSDYKELRKSRSLEEIAQAFQYPTALWLGLVPFLRAPKMIGVKKQRRVKVILEFLEMLKFLMAGNIFCEDGQNRVWGEARVGSTVRKTNWIDVGRRSDFAKLFARLHSDLLSLDEAIFWNANCATREVHGPYRVRWKNTLSQLIVREYYNLSESKFLPSHLSSPYKSVTTFTIYNPKVGFDFPILNDYTHDQPLVENTKAVFGIAERDGETEFLDKKKVVIRNCKIIEEKTFEIGSWVENLDKREQVLESVKRYYYRVKPIRDLLGKDWQAPKSLLKKIKKEFSSFQLSKEKTKMTRKQFYYLWDPRIDL